MSAPDNDTDRGDHGGQTQPGQPPVNVGNLKNAADWLLNEIGDPRTPLAGLFNRGGQLVHARNIDGDGYHRTSDSAGPAIEAIDFHKLGAIVSMNYSPYVMRKFDGVTSTRSPTLYPRDAARAVHNTISQAMELRELRGVTHTPLPRRDGTLIIEPGYDDASGLLYLPADDLDVGDIPEEPTAEQVAEATALIEHMVVDFPWAGPHHKANYLGMLITPLLRELRPGPYKLAAIDAHQPGSGKSLLAKLLRAVHGGKMHGKLPEEAELGKVIFSDLTQTTAPIIEFDNVDGIVRSAKLASLLTSREITDRVLGSTSTVTVANDRLWIFTANNLSLGGDLTRRCTWVVIDPDMESPQTRNGFAIPFLEEWVKEHRSDILRALLIWIAAWRAQGKPQIRTSSDIYGSWIAVLRGVLGVAGISGTFDHEDSVEQQLGEDDDEWGIFLHGVHDKLGSAPWTAKELLARFGDTDLSYTAQLSEDILPSGLTVKHRHHDPYTRLANSFAMWLRNRKGRWASGYVCRQAGHDRTKTMLWKVEREDGLQTRGDPEPTTYDAVEALTQSGLLGDARTEG